MPTEIERKFLVKIELPDWIDQEVSEDLRYFNVNLAQHPFSQW